MKECKDNAVGLDIPNHNEEPQKPMFYGNQSVPHPTNRRARITPAQEVMRNVMDAK